MAEKILKDLLYGDLLAAEPGYITDFAMGMTYSLGFEAMLTAHLAFGMLGDVNDDILQAPHVLLDAITRNSDKVVVFCNKGGIAVPPTIRKVYSLFENNIFEVFDSNQIRANFHPKLWLIRERNRDNSDDVWLKLIVTSRNLAYSDQIDCIACLRGKVENNNIHFRKHRSLQDFIQSVVRHSNIGDSQRKRVMNLVEDLGHVRRFIVDAPFDDYDFFPYLFGENFGLGELESYLVGTESIIVSPFIDASLLERLTQGNRTRRSLITRKEYVGETIFNLLKDKGDILVTIDELASHGMDLHAKMYLVWMGRDNHYLYLGSANATTSAFTNNGEFLLRLKYRHGNTKYDSFMREFYEEGNKENRFYPMPQPLPNAVSLNKWDKAETAMKQLICADDLVARISHHRSGDYTILVTSSYRSADQKIYIAPLQRSTLKAEWKGRCKFEGLMADELSEFYIIESDFVSSEESENIIHHKTIARIRTEGMPADRDKYIYKSIIRSKVDFVNYLEFMLTDSPMQFVSEYLLEQKEHGSASRTDSEVSFPQLYEKMLRVAATNPNQIIEIGRLMQKLDNDVVPPAFSVIYKQFVKALNYTNTQR